MTPNAPITDCSFYPHDLADFHERTIVMGVLSCKKFPSRPG